MNENYVIMILSFAQIGMLMSISYRLGNLEARVKQNTIRITKQLEINK